MRAYLLTLLLTPVLLFAQMKEDENGVAPGASIVLGEKETGVNLRFHYFPSHEMCVGLETNFFPEEGHSISENMEVTLNGHYIIGLNRHWGVYPIGGVGWKRVEEESGWRALMGGGFHGSYGRFAPYIEYIYGAGFEDEGIFIIGTFFTVKFGKEKGE